MSESKGPGQLRIVGKNKDVMEVIKRMKDLMHDGALVSEMDAEEPYIRVDAAEMLRLFNEREMKETFDELDQMQ